SVLGVVQDASVEDGAGWATIRFSTRAEVQPIVADVRDGVIRHVSVGYSVDRWQDSAAAGVRTRTAISWTPREISFVPLPADPGASVRNHMTETTTAEADTRAEVNTQIRSIATVSGMDAAFAAAQIDRGATVEQARAAAFEELVQRGGGTIRTQRVEVGQDHTDPAALVTRMGEALACSLTGQAPSDAARPFMGMGMADSARALLAARGERVSTLSREEVLTRAAAHTLSDFPNLLTGVGNRVLLPAYQAAQTPLRQLARQRNAADFRPVSLLRIGEFGKLKPVNEMGEIKALTTGEAKEGYALETFGGMFALSRKAIINDDLGAFGQWSAMMGRAAAETEADQLVQMVIQASGAGPVMGDGKRLFHTDHGNLATPGPLNVASLSAARLAMRTQKGLDGKSPINVTPKYLLSTPTCRAHRGRRWPLATAGRFWPASSAWCSTSAAAPSTGVAPTGTQGPDVLDRGSSGVAGCAGAHPHVRHPTRTVRRPARGVPLRRRAGCRHRRGRPNARCSSAADASHRHSLPQQQRALTHA
ncbi:MAG: hypothetical protein E7K72_18280, partial [Roseomonas mucosa]|nr:hypothetical protein [Roseomonas mucosa]